MVTRRANGRQHEAKGERTLEREEESNNPMLRQILERVDQLQQQNQTLQQQSQSLQTRMNALTRGRAEDEDIEACLGEFHPFSPEIAEA
ncbi:GTP-binding protein [Sesbania bispinosa]|nr:GTP-binding protein [Sesbania bispinosa]